MKLAQLFVGALAFIFAILFYSQINAAERVTANPEINKSVRPQSACSQALANLRSEVNGLERDFANYNNAVTSAKAALEKGAPAQTYLARMNGNATTLSSRRKRTSESWKRVGLVCHISELTLQQREEMKAISQRLIEFAKTGKKLDSPVSKQVKRTQPVKTWEPSIATCTAKIVCGSENLNACRTCCTQLPTAKGGINDPRSMRYLQQCQSACYFTVMNCCKDTSHCHSKYKCDEKLCSDCCNQNCPGDNLECLSRCQRTATMCALDEMIEDRFHTINKASEISGV